MVAGECRVNDGGEVDGVAVLVELTIDADVVLTEGTGAEDGDSGFIERQGMRLARGSLALDGGEASAVEVEEVRDLVVGLSGGWRGEAGGGAALLAADAGGGSDEFEQIEGDIFIAAGCGTGGGCWDFHEFPPW
jgi:hypothetical protein